jgi:hypothetical protein
LDNPAPEDSNSKKGSLAFWQKKKKNPSMKHMDIRDMFKKASE